MNKKIDGVLRCMVCGEEQPRVAAGLNWGFPKHCDQKMVVVTAQQLADEQEYQDRLEAEQKYLESSYSSNASIKSEVI